ncbi:MAG: FAD/NAD(P)-binding oxidoreductase [Nitriliruptoraceae bacterium]
MARTLVLGGGFGGLAAATHLRRVLPSSDEVVLVARDHRFAMGWAKIWDLVGIRALADGTRELPDLRERGIDFRHADITQIAAEDGGVVTTDGDVAADGMVIALGAPSHPDQAAQLDGAFGHDLYDVRALEGAKLALAGLTEGQLVVAIMGQPVKCPPAPFEAILALDAHLRARGVRDAIELTLATPSPGALPVAGADASEAVAARLIERGIGLRLEHLATAVDHVSRTVTFDTGARISADLVFGVPAAAPPRVVSESSVAAADGWIHPDPQQLTTSAERVYAVGDCTTIPTATAALPKAGVFAAGAGRVAAANLAADLDAGPRAEFDGHGHCYLEFPGQEVAVVEGDFFARPVPQVSLTAPSRAAYDDKLAFEAQLLNEWFG